MFSDQFKDLLSSFWFYQIVGWSFYFCYTTLSSIDVLESLKVAVMVNGAFTLMGFIFSGGLHFLLSKNWCDRSHVSNAFLGGLFSIAASAVIMVTINIQLLPYLLDITITSDNWTILFRGTLKYSFVFLAWVGFYMGGRFRKEMDYQALTDDTGSLEEEVTITSHDVGQTQELSFEDSLFISDKKNSKFIKINKISHITAEGAYSRLFEKGGNSHLLSKPLKDWEAILDDVHFKRIHRSHIVNVSYIRDVERWFNFTYKIYLENRDEPIDMSRRYASKLKFN